MLWYIRLQHAALPLGNHDLQELLISSIPESKVSPKITMLGWLRPRMDRSSHIPQPAQGEHQKYELRQCDRGQVGSAYLV